MALAYDEILPYGAAAVVYFALEDGADATELYTGTDFAAGDVKISKDGGALANTTNLPAQITAAQPGYSLTLTAAEMSASRVLITMRDASAAVWRGVAMVLKTRISLTTISVDATNLGGNNSAVFFLGVGTGSGLFSQGGATGHGLAGLGGATSGQGLQVAALAGNSHGAVFSGTGTGHGITGVATGTGRICNLFDTIQGGEPTTKPSATFTYGQILQALQRRFYNRVTQTTATQIQYRDDGVTVLTQMAVSDDGVTQTKGVAT